MTNCPYCGGEIPSTDFAVKTPEGNFFHFVCADICADDWIKMRDKMQAINDLTVSYQEEGPFDTQEAFDRVAKIYDLSLGKE